MFVALRCLLRRTPAALLLCLFAGSLGLQAQAPVALPYTISTYAGTYNGAIAVGAGKLCNGGGTPGTGNTQPVATNALNDGCPASQAIFSTDLRGGLAVDALGNVYVADTSSLEIRKIDARSGLITDFVGAQTACAASVDKPGDGCPIGTTGVFNNPRGIGIDPAGNVLIAGYSDQLVHVVCTAVSPLCSAAQVGTMRVAAGCVTTAAANGTAEAGPDGVSATPAGTCSATTGGVNQPRGAWGDAFGNVYVADTGNLRFRVVLGPAAYNGVTNPLYAVLKTGSTNGGLANYATLTAGNIYALFGSNATGGTQFVTPAAGAACAIGSAATALDANGDGCPFYNSKVSAGGGAVQAIAADANGNVFFADGNGLVRVMYVAGTAVANAIKANNPTVTTPQVGSTYVLAGGGTTNSLGLTPVLGTTTSLGNIYKLTVDHLGNLFLGDATASSADFFDMQTGYLRKVAVGTGTVCTTGANGAPNAIGDGCPATQATFSGGNGIGVGVDQLGNLYLADVTHALIRKVSAVSFAPTAANSTATPGLFLHAEPGATALTPTLAAGTDFALGTPACTTNTPGANAGSGDSSLDCVYPVTVKPTGVGTRGAALTVAQTTTGTAGTLATALSTTSIGSSLTFDPASVAAAASTVGSYAPTAVTVDGANNTYVASAGSIVKIPAGAQGAAIASSVGSVTSLSADAAGNVYYTLASGGNLGKLSFTPTATFVSTPIATGVTPTAAVADALGDVFFYDSSTKTLVRYTAATGAFMTLTPAGATFTAVTSLALDRFGNVLVADSGAGAVYRVPSAGGAAVAVTVGQTITPVGVAADASGNVYIADTTSQSVLMVPATGAVTTVASGFGALNGLSLDAANNVYASDAGKGTIAANLTIINRAAFAYVYPSAATSLTGTLTNAGNMASTGFAQSDAANFSLFNTGATCATGTALGTGAACTINAQFLPPSTGGGTLNGTVQLAPVASTVGLLSLQATVAGNAVTTTTVITGPTQTAPTYSATTTEATFTVTVTASSGNPTGVVNVSIDGGTATQYTLTAGSGTTATATVALTGLIASNHTISATYPLTGAFNGSTTANPTSFSIAQAATAISWSPSATTLQYGVAIGTGIFDATAVNAGVTIPGSFVYTATAPGGTAKMVDSASYLAILTSGGYTLAVTFTPNDAVDYTGSSMTLATPLTVTKATTTAAVGASTMVVAADGTANFTSVESAVNALPATGGNVYLAPGTYKEQVLVAVPNVALHGLGGNPQNVVLTSETGAFGGANPTLGIAANPYGFNNDEGSATLVVAKGTVNGTSYTPTNFFLENLSITNTYDTDTTNTNAIMGSNQSCTAVSTSSNNTLFNAGTLCASQALTVWITADKSVFNNVRLNSLQDTLAAYNTSGSNAASGIASTSRQYYWKSYITGDIDYVFGDAAAVFDQVQFYTQYHNGSASGNATVFAQNKAQQTGSSTDYLSGYVANNSTFTSQNVTTAPMTSLYFGRPYGTYATTVLINNAVDDVNALGFEPFTGSTVLPTAAYFEYGTTCTTSNCTTTGRETQSMQPEMVAAAAAEKFAPVTFLSTPSPDVWNPVAALATGINGYVPAATSLTINYGQSVTVLLRPQTPGGGAVPTGTYTLTDNGTSIVTASGTLNGTLDATGAAYLTSSTFTPGTHNLVMTYAGDTNFSGSTSSAFVLTVNGVTTMTTVNVTTATPTYGQAVTVTATVAATSGAMPAGTVQLTVDSAAPVTATVTNGVATFTLNGLAAGTHSLSATYQANAGDLTSTGTGSVTLAKAVLTVTANSASRAFETANPVFTATFSGFAAGDSASSVSGAPAFTTAAVPNSPAGAYSITPSVGTLTAANYSFSFVAGTLTVTGGAAQAIVFGPLPNLPVATTAPLYGRALSGLPVTYTVSGPATITASGSGSTITVNGAGTVTVTATQTGNATFSAATSVSRSFTAQ